MPTKLVMRIVRADNSRRVSVYRRPDGRYFYAEEQFSEWDDTPPAWVESVVSGIFSSAEDAMVEGKQTIDWTRSSPETGLQHFSLAAPCRQWRPIGVAERAVLLHLLRGEFQGRKELLQQLQSVEVMRIGQGYSLMLRSDGHCAEVNDSDAASQRPNDRIATEGFYDDIINETKGGIRFGAIVRLALHVTEGKISELEVYKEDGTPILMDPYEIELSRIHFY